MFVPNCAAVPSPPLPGSADELLQKYDELNKAMRPLIAQGLSAAIYTETSDIEGEINGFMTYDREIIKVPAARIKASNETLKQEAEIQPFQRSDDHTN